MVSKDGGILCQQDGVFRTNCMDCLDRTNVVQGMLAKITLEEQLKVSLQFGLKDTCRFKPLQDDRMLDWFKLKQIADDI